MFHALITLKEAVVREWPLLTPSQIEELKTLLLHYAMQRPGYGERETETETETDRQTACQTETERERGE